MKKIISLLLASILLISAFSITTFAEEMDEAWPFTDVKESAWYYEGIAFCYYNGIVKGMTDTTFVPNGTLTRAQFVQILAMYAGVDLTVYKDTDSGFDDVKTAHWFNAPVCWAVEQGFVKGVTETKFGPNQPITREQLARLLYLFGEFCKLDMSHLADLTVYEDESKVSDWAYTQIQWAVAAGIISGTSDTTLSPRATATRAQACRMIMTFDEFACFGYVDRGGAYEVIVEYIKENGEYFSDINCYSYFMEYEGYDLFMEYSKSDKSFNISYLCEPYEFEEDGELFIGYREIGSLYAYYLSSEYSFNYFKENADGTKYMSTYGNMTCYGYEEYGQFSEGYENIELIDGASNVQFYIREQLTLILAEADMTLEDFFLPEEEDPNKVMYDMFIDYICANGIEDTENGVIDLIEETGDKVYVAEYSIAEDVLYIVYVSEPKAGGTDVFDTEYCEKAILAISYPVGDDEIFIYTYENEEGTRSISGSFTADIGELQSGEYNYLGYDKTTALNMINNAYTEVLEYLERLINEVLGPPIL